LFFAIVTAYLPIVMQAHADHNQWKDAKSEKGEELSEKSDGLSEMRDAKNS
jgi:hypothetical protein